LFCGAGGQSSQGAILVYPRGGWGKTTKHLVLTCWSAKCLPTRFGAASCGAGALLFFQCNVAWRSFVWARGSGCWSFESSWCFISAQGVSSLSARFLIYRAHSVCFCTLVTILDPQSL
jgi:hypothetical protein